MKTFEIIVSFSMIKITETIQVKQIAMKS